MEAAPRLQMLCFELKHTPKPAEFAHPLKRFIANFYNEDPANYTKAIHDMEQLRVAACMASKDPAGVAVLKRYYSQLRSLQNRFPMTDDGAACVAFMWTDLYSGRVFNIADVKYELSSVLYNIGALYSQLGALEDRTAGDGMRTACTYFQRAAWAFQHNRDSYPQPKGCDLSHDLLTFYSFVMLAQSQECILEKSLLDNRKSAISAKIAMQIVDFYAKAMNHLSADIKEIVGSEIYLQWRRICEMKASYYGAVAALHMGMCAEDEGSYGLRVAWYQEAMRRFTESLHAARDLSIDDTLAFTADVIGGKLAAAEKENNFVYHDKVPPPESLPEVKGAPLVKGIPFDPCDPEVSGPDLFASLIPMGAHEASSVYSEKKAQILRAESDIVEEKNAELAAYESSLNLDKNTLNAILVKPSLPPDIIEVCARFNTRGTAVSDLNAQLVRLHKMADDIGRLLEEAEEQLKEARPDGVTSNVVADLRAELNKYREIHAHSSKSNDTLREALKAHDEKLALLQLTPDVMQQKLPHVIEATSEDAKVIHELIRLFDKMDEMKVQRSKLFNDLRESIRNDDITKLIVANAQEDLNEVFEKALSKHKDAISVLDANLRAQDNILKAVTQANANAAEVRLNLEQARQPWNQAIEGLRVSARAFEEVEAQTLKGLDFFDKFHGNVSKLVTRLKSVVQVEREQEERLKMRQAAEAAAATAAVTVVTPNVTQVDQQVGPLSFTGHHTSGGMPSFGSSAGPQKVSQPNPTATPPPAGGQSAPKLKDYLALMNKAKQGNVNEYVPHAMPGSPGISQPASNSTVAMSPMNPSTLLAAAGPYALPQMSSQLHQPYPQSAQGVAGSTQDAQSTANTSSIAGSLPPGSQPPSKGFPDGNAMPQAASSQRVQPASVFNMPLPAGHKQQAEQTSAQPSQVSAATAVGTATGHGVVAQPSTFTTQQQNQFYAAYNARNLAYSGYGGTAAYHPTYGMYSHLYSSSQPATTTNGTTGSVAVGGAVATGAPTTAPSSSTANTANYYGTQQTHTPASVPTSSGSYAYPSGYQQYSQATAQQQYPYGSPYGGCPTQSPSVSSSGGAAVAQQATTVGQVTSCPSTVGSATAAAAAPATPATAYGAYHPYGSSTLPTQYTTPQGSYAATSYGQYNVGQTPTNVTGGLPSSSTPRTTASAATGVVSATTTPAATSTVASNASVSTTTAGSSLARNNQMYHWSGYGNLPRASPTASASTYITSGPPSLSYQATFVSAPSAAMYTNQQYAQYYQQYGQPYQQYSSNNNSAGQQQPNSSNGPASNAPTAMTSAVNATTVSTVQPGQASQTAALPNGYFVQATGQTSQAGQQNYSTAYYQAAGNQPLPSVQSAGQAPTSLPQATPTPGSVSSTVTQGSTHGSTSSVSNLLDDSPQLSVSSEGGALSSILQPTVVSSSGQQSECNVATANVCREDQAGSHTVDQRLENSEPSDSQVYRTHDPAQQGTTDVVGAVVESTNEPVFQPVEPSDQKGTTVRNASAVSPAAIAQDSESAAIPAAPTSTVVDPPNDRQVANDLKNTFDKLDDMIRTLQLEVRWKEYLDIQEAEARNLKISVGRICSMKNRFPDIMPYDQNRVVLTSSKDDYINASFVTSSVEREPNYIITQAPLAATFEDFWTMVWEQGVETVLSLSSFKELSSQLFFPSEKGTSQCYGPFHVTVLSFSEKQGGLFTERLLAVNGPQGPTKNVILVHINEWTRDTAQHVALSEHVLDLHLRQRRSHNPPIVLQCLGGCGRSGILAFALRWISHLQVGRIPSDVLAVLRGLVRARKLILLEKDQLRLCFEIALATTRAELQTRGLIAPPVVPTALDQMDEKEKKGQPLSAEERIIQDLMQGFQVKAKITKESFENLRGLEAKPGGGDPNDPLSQLDPLWSLKKT